MKFNFVLCSGIAAIGLLSACSAKPGNNPALADGKSRIAAAAKPEDVVFDCFNVNYAWGYRLSGFFIDREGNVYHYRSNASSWKPKPIEQGMSLYYSSTELRSKFTYKTLQSSIDPVQLQDKVALIDHAASGAVSSRAMRGADQGHSVCVAYRYVENQDRYQQIELGSYGPTQIQTVNSAPAAQALLQWLVSIGRK